eukprot:gene934-1180_t
MVDSTTVSSGSCPDTKDLFVQEYEINLSKTNELATVQYFCNKAGEPIYFPDRTLATLFQVNLSTLRGRFNRLTKRHEGYRLLISEKSKARLSSLHFITLSEWIAHNHERLGTSLKDIENNLTKANLSFTRHMDTITILQKKFTGNSNNNNIVNINNNVLSSSHNKSQQQQRQPMQQIPTQQHHHHHNVSPPSSPYSPKLLPYSTSFVPHQLPHDHPYYAYSHVYQPPPPPSNYPYPQHSNSAGNSHQIPPDPSSLPPLLYQHSLLPNIHQQQRSQTTASIALQQAPQQPPHIRPILAAPNLLVPVFSPNSPSSQYSPSSSPSYREFEDDLRERNSKKRSSRDYYDSCGETPEASPSSANSSPTLSLFLPPTVQLNNNNNLVAMVNKKLKHDGPEFSSSSSSLSCNSNIHLTTPHKMYNPPSPLHHHHVVNASSNANNNCACNFVKCKLYEEDSYKKVDIAQLHSFSSLRETLSSMFGIQSFVLCYHDSDNDVIDLNEHEDDWHDFCTSVKKVTLKPYNCVTPDLKNLLNC